MALTKTLKAFFNKFYGINPTGNSVSKVLKNVVDSNSSLSSGDSSEGSIGMDNELVKIIRVAQEYPEEVDPGDSVSFKAKIYGMPEDFVFVGEPWLSYGESDDPLTPGMWEFSPYARLQDGELTLRMDCKNVSDLKCELYNEFIYLNILMINKNLIEDRTSDA